MSRTAVISREKALRAVDNAKRMIEALNRYDTDTGRMDGDSEFIREAALWAVTKAKEVIDNLPAESVDAEATATWVKMSDADGVYFCCSECGNALPRYREANLTSDGKFPAMVSIHKTVYCPTCGVHMAL